MIDHKFYEQLLSMLHQSEKFLWGFSLTRFFIVLSEATKNFIFYILM